MKSSESSYIKLHSFFKDFMEDSMTMKSFGWTNFFLAKEIGLFIFPRDFLSKIKVIENGKLSRENRLSYIRQNVKAFSKICNENSAVYFCNVFIDFNCYLLV